MAEVNAKQQSKATPQVSRENRGSQSTVAGTGAPRQRDGSEFLLLFSVSPRDFPASGQFERLWWVSAPRTAH
jgi:hypothetical protein